MKKLAFLLALVPFCWSNQQPAAPQPQIATEIQDILERQKTAWNQKDIEGFMAYYWKSEGFTFQSGNNRLRGWEALLQRYKKSYSGENWGGLNFTDMEIKILTEEYVYVLGRWKLTGQETTKEGLFTIILRRFPEGWRIIHDHSS